MTQEIETKPETNLRDYEQKKIQEKLQTIPIIKEKLYAQGFSIQENDSLEWNSKMLGITVTVSFNGIIAEVESSYYDGTTESDMQDPETVIVPIDEVVDYCIEKIKELIEDI
ncbi:hypothetical protein [Geminocystis sp. NIES-3709]|uniref:hypothetical protein n=1 Tax=Geminocystis sp. NIES-3709 TaxID=1617448 RepID=UPI0005FCB185|nr:hypothetical protein [Geminocystis sp. NIES-3709]BAQ67092.1 hypothetical protein GM3709_3857 [Geminocystis sp. NIES-3709]